MKDIRRHSIRHWIRNSAIVCAALLPAAPLRAGDPNSQDHAINGESEPNSAATTGPQLRYELLPPADEASAPAFVLPGMTLNADPHSTDEPCSAPGGYSWRARPFSGGYQVGLIASHLPTDHLEDAAGLLLSKRYGWDFADRWGLEARLAEGWLRDARILGSAQRESQRATYGDLSLLFYPWPMTRLRPFVSVGAGAADFHFTDLNGQTTDQVLATMPFGLGLKYPVKDWLILRGEVFDNLSFGDDDLPLTNNLSFNGGVEVRFGDLRKHLWPWGRQPAPQTKSYDGTSGTP